MSFNIEKTLDEMAAAAAAVVKNDLPEAEELLKQVIEDEKQALKEITDAYLKRMKQLQEDLKSQLEDEKKVIESAKLLAKVKGKKAVEDAINAAMDVFWKAVKAAL